MFDYANIRLIYLQSLSHQSLLGRGLENTKIFTLSHDMKLYLTVKDYDFIALDMGHLRSMQILKQLKKSSPQSYVIVSSTNEKILMQALKEGADASLINPMDKDECDRVLYKAASYVNMQEIFYQTYYLDDQSSLENLDALKKRLEYRQKDTLIRLSLRNYKNYQIYYGVEITNRVLIKLAEAIKLNLPLSARIYKTAEDEFSILLDMPVSAQVQMLSQQLKSFFEQEHISLEELDFNCDLDIGVSSGIDLIKRAGIALSEAKEGRGLAYYDEASSFVQRQKENIRWMQIVQEAIREDRVMAYYQPIMGNEYINIMKYEALCRIESKEGNIYNPAEFMDAVRMAGHLCDITRIMIDKTFKYFKDNNYSFSINISKEDFLADYLYGFIAHKCDYYDIEPSRVYIEILETISNASVHSFIRQIEELKELGCNISIDDFGTDSSNFSRVMQLKAEVLKIDGEFIQKLLIEENARIIVENIVSFAKKIGAETVAEFVDSKELYQLVRQMGVNYSQGYYIGKPSKEILKDSMSFKAANRIA